MTIREFSRRVGVDTYTIRYYEKIGLLRDIQRRPNGHRIFSDDDVRWIEFVLRLKETGMPLDQIREYADLRERGDSTLSARHRLLEAHARVLEDGLARQRRHLDTLKEKISFYESQIRAQKNP